MCILFDVLFAKHPIFFYCTNKIANYGQILPQYCIISKFIDYASHTVLSSQMHIPDLSGV